MTRTLQQCQDRSNQRFPLSDLLAVPIQRFLKYPLLVKVGFQLEHITCLLTLLYGAATGGSQVCKERSRVRPVGTKQSGVCDEHARGTV